MRASATYLAEPFACLAVLCLAPTPAAAQDVAFDIPAGRLSDALVSLGQQAGITIGASDPNLATVRSRQVHGRMTVGEALSRLLACSLHGTHGILPEPRIQIQSCHQVLASKPERIAVLIPAIDEIAAKEPIRGEEESAGVLGAAA